MSESFRKTADPHVLIEEQRDGYVRYRNDQGDRWEVLGICDQRGDCLIGAVIDGIEVRDKQHLFELGPRPDSKLDVPVAKGFSGCCPLEVVELDCC